MKRVLHHGLTVLSWKSSVMPEESPQQAAGCRIPGASDAVLAAVFFAVDPIGTGGIALRTFAGPARDRWLALLRESAGAAINLRRIPIHAADSRLLGGLDLAATLASGRMVADRGILAESDGGIVLIPMAERLTTAMAAKLCAVIDAGEVVLERDGIRCRSTARFGVVLLDEGLSGDERPPASLLDRLAFHIDLSAVPAGGFEDFYAIDRLELDEARSRLSEVKVSAEMVAAICAAAKALGVDSIRASLLAVRVARVSAALEGRLEVAVEDAATAARLVLASRATLLPVPEDSAESETDENPQPEDPAGTAEAQGEPQPDDDSGQQNLPIEDVVLASAQAAIPAGLLEQIQAAGAGQRSPSSGRAGVPRNSGKRGRPIGARRGSLRRGARLNVMETMRAAAPWQPLRRREVECDGVPLASRPLVHIRQDDFRVTHFKEKTETTIIFVVDASGSSALHRLAEVKGAVELLLADCYVRRDRVAVIAFRGKAAELLLPPTRSLVRAKRSLSMLPGGGGTPLASAMDASLVMAEAARRRGEVPTVLFLTDGRANVARDGTPDRARAEQEAFVAARRFPAANLFTLLIDTSPQPRLEAKHLSKEMCARYVPLPYAQSSSLAKAIRAEVTPSESHPEASASLR